MKKKRTPIEELITRFTEGYTTEKEEKELYCFFNSEKVPPHLEKYIPVFKYFHKELPEELAETAEKHTGLVRKSRWKQFILWSSSTAAILLVTMLIFRHENISTLADPYEGSYIVRNQIRIYDKELILAEAEEIDALFAEQEKEFCQLFREEEEIENLFNVVE